MGTEKTQDNELLTSSDAQGKTCPSESPLSKAVLEHVATQEGPSVIKVENNIAQPPVGAKTTLQPNLISWGRPLPLYRFDDIPTWQRYNPFIRDSYRAFYDTKMTWKSFLGWHNETLNVWTHFGGFIFFVYLTYVLISAVMLESNGGFSPYLEGAPIFYYLFCTGCLGCTICSTLFHLFTGHCNCTLMKLMGQIDFIGITLLIIGSFLPPLYVLLHCFPGIRLFYLVSVGTLGCLTCAACFSKIFFEHRALRVSLFIALAVSGAAPLGHSLYLYPYSPQIHSIVYGIGLMVTLYLTGVVFYCTNFPEAWFPSHFDCLLSSHQIWHAFVLLASFVHFFNCASMYQMFTVSDGTC